MAFPRNSLITLGFIVLFGATGCGGDDSSPGGGSGGGGTGGTGGGSGGTSGAGAAAGSGGGTFQCDPGPGYSGSVATQKVDSLNGKVVDLDGNPAPKTVTTVCGLSLCIFGSTDDQGVVVTCDNQTSICSPGIAPNVDMKKPAFKYALGLNYAKFALLLPAGKSVHDVGTQVTARFPDFSAGSDLVAGQESSSAGVTVRLAAGTDIKFEPDFITSEEKRFRAVEIPMAKAPEAVDKSLGFDGVVATTPVDTDFCPFADLSLPNNYGYAAGDDVEIWIHGVDPEEAWAPYGGWGKVSDAKVSSDGTRIETVAGQGIPMLGNFGIRKKP